MKYLLEPVSEAYALKGSWGLDLEEPHRMLSKIFS
jgi:hypothetical protein